MIDGRSVAITVLFICGAGLIAMFSFGLGQDRLLAELKSYGCEKTMEVHANDRLAR